MVLDSSAVLAILLNEPEAPRFEAAIEKNPTRFMSAASVLEVSIVLETRKGEAGRDELDLLLYKTKIEIVPVMEGQINVGRLAFRRYGKGRHPAGLNFGDCFSYALAKVLGEPLLFKGDDFNRTDLECVPLPEIEK